MQESVHTHFIALRLVEINVCHHLLYFQRTYARMCHEARGPARAYPTGTLLCTHVRTRPTVQHYLWPGVWVAGCEGVSGSLLRYTAPRPTIC